VQRDDALALMYVSHFAVLVKLSYYLQRGLLVVLPARGLDREVRRVDGPQLLPEHDHWGINVHDADIAARRLRLCQLIRLVAACSSRL
jgi:hypothetical protein